MLIELPEYKFNWSLWRAGSIHDLNIPCRYASITSEEGKLILRKYAIGYCDGAKLSCRNKPGHVAIMFYFEHRHFWFHLRKKEFDCVFLDKC